MKTRSILILCAFMSLGACASNDSPPTPGSPAAKAAEVNADIKALNKLAGITIDAQALYVEAAEITKNPDLKAELLTLARKREDLTNQFQRKAQEMGADPETKGTALGVGHRLFADIRSAFDNNQQTAAGEVLRGENFLLDEMQEVIDDPVVGVEVKNLVRSLRPTVEADRDSVNALVLRFRSER